MTATADGPRPGHSSRSPPTRGATASTWSHHAPSTIISSYSGSCSSIEPASRSDAPSARRPRTAARGASRRATGQRGPSRRRPSIEFAGWAASARCSRERPHRSVAERRGTASSTSCKPASAVHVEGPPPLRGRRRCFRERHVGRHQSILARTAWAGAGARSDCLRHDKDVAGLLDVVTAAVPDEQRSSDRLSPGVGGNSAIDYWHDADWHTHHPHRRHRCDWMLDRGSHGKKVAHGSHDQDARCLEESDEAGGRLRLLRARLGGLEGVDLPDRLHPRVRPRGDDRALRPQLDGGRRSGRRE